MDWNERFDRLNPMQRLGVAAITAERVLPLAAGVSELEDSLRLVWLHIAGLSRSKQDLARTLNAAIDAARLAPGEATTRAHAARATFAVVDAALNSNDAALEAVQLALRAVQSFNPRGVPEELAWLDWALLAAAETPLPSRATFHDVGAPQPSWITELSRADLPLFDRRA